MTSGCASVSSPTVSDGLSEQLNRQSSSARNPTRVQVVVRPAKGAPEGAEVAYRENMLLSQALSETGGDSRFRRIKLSLVRAGVTDPLRVNYNNSTDVVGPLYDYTLRPGDKIIVSEDTSTVLDDMLKTIPFVGGSE